MSVLDAFKAKVSSLGGRSATVRSVDVLSPNLRAIRFEGPDLVGFGANPGDKIKLGVGGALRSYTPYDLDPRSGALSVVFHLHGKGSAASWAAKAKGGEAASILGPGRSMAAATDAPWGAFFGDETTLGLARALVRAPPTRPVLGAVELAEDDLRATAALGLDLAGVERRAGHGTALLEAASALELPEGPGVIWLSGHAGSVRALWAHFLGRGIPRERILARPYWSDRGTSHRKAVAREMR